MGYAELFNGIKRILGEKRYEIARNKVLESGEDSLSNILFTAIEDLIGENRSLLEDARMLENKLDDANDELYRIRCRLKEYNFDDDLNHLENDDN